MSASDILAHVERMLAASLLYLCWRSLGVISWHLHNLRGLPLSQTGKNARSAPGGASHKT